MPRFHPTNPDEYPEEPWTRLDRAVKAWAKVRTARATFEQSITNPLTGRVMTSTAEFQQQIKNELAANEILVKAIGLTAQ